MTAFGTRIAMVAIALVAAALSTISTDDGWSRIHDAPQRPMVAEIVATKGATAP